MEEAATPYDIIDPLAPAFEVGLLYWAALFALLAFFWILFLLYSSSLSKHSVPAWQGSLNSLQEEIRTAGQGYCSDSTKDRLSYFVKLFRRYLSRLPNTVLPNSTDRHELETHLATIEQLRFARELSPEVKKSIGVLLRKMDDVG